MARIGELLLQRDLIRPERLERALRLQQRSALSLGSVLMGEGDIAPVPLHQLLAEQLRLPFADLMREPPAPHLLDAARREDYQHLRLIPWRQEGATVLLATPSVTDEVKEWAAQHYPHRHRFALTSPRDVTHTLETRFAAEDDAEARLALWSRHPERSARTLFHGHAHPAALLLLAMALLAAALYPASALFAVTFAIQCFYAATLIFKGAMFSSGLSCANRVRRENRYDRPELLIPDRELPVYTILVPLYRETEALPGLIASLRALDYPRAKLDIKLVVEADDRETLAAIHQAKPESMFEIIRVPPSQPRTKPKACNYALRFARGDLLTIFDAEDRPAPAQLRQAVHRFSELPEDVVCLQGRLNYYNRDANLLTRLFAIEYAAWFDFMLRGLESYGMPLPLGGTSFHISLAKLRELGAWDPFNVTEDADLGIRLAGLKYKTALLESVTLEEAPARLGDWLKQRSRWIKGYIQTYITHMRAPRRLYRTLGPSGFFGFQLFIGGPSLVFLSAPFLWIGAGLWAAGVLSPPPGTMLNILLLLSTANFALGVGLHLLMAMTIVTRRRWRGMTLAGACFPFYWILHSLASFKALWQLITAPHYWEKTPHGITRTSAEELKRMHEEFAK
ncbi:MAG: glycosyltransferase [Alphaproteobacteria bacterium]|nr:glycosyltransferase [Alphaproteobacteria bacterium]